MAHASEMLEGVARHRLAYVEHPTTIVYTPYSRRKGQKLSGAFAILADLVIQRISR